jgi:hypothetical protein
MRVWLASYPRSGNTFFRIILSDRYGIPSITPRMAPESWEKLWRIDAKRQPSPDPTAPEFVKTHALPGDDSAPAIYIARDGRDALVSYAHFALAFNREPTAEPVTPKLFRATLRNLILETQSAFGSWATNVEAWTARPNTVVVRYEDLLADPLGVADRALASLGLHLLPVADAITTFDELREVDPKFFRRGVQGCHRDEFPLDLLELFWARNGATMTRLGYTRDAARRAA